MTKIQSKLRQQPWMQQESNRDLVLIDTAGRLHIDSQLMDELHQMRQRVNPQEILFVADAMTGQMLSIWPRASTMSSI